MESMGIQWKSDGDPMEVLWESECRSCGNLSGILRKSYENSTQILWTYRDLSETFRTSYEHLKESYGNPEDILGNPMEMCANHEEIRRNLMEIFWKS